MFRVSCRYGCGRFLTVSVKFDKHQQAQAKALGSRFVNALNSGKLEIAGCKYKLCRISNPNTKKGEIKERSLGDITFFAESGPGLEKIRFDQVQDWHNPPSVWPPMFSLVKYNKYNDLMFSDADATCSVDPSQFTHTEDVCSTETNALMSDGSVALSAV